MLSGSEKLRVTLTSGRVGGRLQTGQHIVYQQPWRNRFISWIKGCLATEVCIWRGEKKGLLVCNIDFSDFNFLW